VEQPHPELATIVFVVIGAIHRSRVNRCIGFELSVADCRSPQRLTRIPSLGAAAAQHRRLSTTVTTAVA
jgi:hypothetical protein